MPSPPLSLSSLQTTKSDLEEVTVGNAVKKLLADLVRACGGNSCVRPPRHKWDSVAIPTLTFAIESLGGGGAPFKRHPRKEEGRK